MAARWHVSILLLIAYLSAFHFWMVANAVGRMISTGLLVAALIPMLFRAARKGYFVNCWDLAFHSAVVLDIAAEGLFISVHDDFGFYLCALAFAVVIAGYRTLLLRKQSAPA